MHRALLACLVFVSELSVGSQEAPRGPAQRESPDRAVLETVLKDLLSVKDSPLEIRKGKKRILFSPEALSRRTDLDTVLRRHDEAQWKRLTAEQLAQTQRAANDLVRRAAAKESFGAFASKDPRIVVYGPEEERDRKAARQFVYYV
jgi:hypothetical protein